MSSYSPAGCHVTVPRPETTVSPDALLAPAGDFEEPRSGGARKRLGVVDVRATAGAGDRSSPGARYPSRGPGRARAGRPRRVRGRATRVPADGCGGGPD